MTVMNEAAQTGVKTKCSHSYPFHVHATKEGDKVLPWVPGIIITVIVAFLFNVNIVFVCHSVAIDANVSYVYVDYFGLPIPSALQVTWM